MLTSVATPQWSEHALLPRATATTSTPTYTSAIPLTTIFTPPANCFGQSYTLSPNGLDSLTSISYASVWKGITSSCYPPDFSLIDSGQQVGLAPYYSPGVCPDNWATVGYTSGSDQNIATCCPILTVSDFIFDVNPVQTQTLQYIRTACGALAPGPQENALEMTIYGTQFTNGLTRVYGNEIHISAITIAWQNSGSVIASATSTADSVSSGPPPPTAAADTSASDGSSDSFSTAAKVGVAVGVAFGVLLVVAVVAVCVWRRRRRRRGEQISPQELDGGYAKVELHGDGAVEADYQPVHELLGGTMQPGEAPETQIRHELEGEWQGGDTSQKSRDDEQWAMHQSGR